MTDDILTRIDDLRAARQKWRRQWVYCRPMPLDVLVDNALGGVHAEIVRLRQPAELTLPTPPNLPSRLLKRLTALCAPSPDILTILRHGRDQCLLLGAPDRLPKLLSDAEADIVRLRAARAAKETPHD